VCVPEMLTEYSLAWELSGQMKGGSLGHYYTCYFLNFTSQTWLTPADSSAYVWRHWIQVCVPDVVLTPTVRVQMLYCISSCNHFLIGLPVYQRRQQQR
jgi:hypothetical protein